MSADTLADIFEKAGAPYNAATDAYSRSTIGAAAVPAETAAVVNQPIGIGWMDQPGVNMLEKTQLFSNAYWSKVRSSISADAIAAPDGTLTADKLIEDTSTNTHYIDRSTIAAAAGVPYVFSVYAKAGERSIIRLRGATQAGFLCDIYANLLTGAVVLSGASGVATPLSIGGCDYVGDGWWRVWVQRITPLLTTSVNFAVWLVDTGINTSYTGNGVSGVYLWGAQLEQSERLNAYTAVA